MALEISLYFVINCFYYLEKIDLTPSIYVMLNCSFWIKEKQKTILTESHKLKSTLAFEVMSHLYF